MYHWNTTGKSVSEVRLLVWRQFGVALNFDEGLRLRNRGIKHEGYRIVAPQVGIISASGVEVTTGNADVYRVAEVCFIERSRWNKERIRAMSELKRMEQPNVP